MWYLLQKLKKDNINIIDKADILIFNIYKYVLYLNLSL